MNIRKSRTLRLARVRRGDSLVEVVIALMLTASVVLGMTAWLSGIFVGSNILGAAAAPTSDMQLVKSTLAADLTGAVVCDPSGQGVPFYSFSSSSIGLYEPDPTVSGQIDLVLWQLSGSTIERAVIAPTGSACNFDTASATWNVIAPHAQSLNFTPTYEGTVVSIPPTSLGGNCEGAPGTPNAPENCFFQTVMVQVTLLGALGSDTEPQTLNAQWNVNLSSSSLAPNPSQVPQANPAVPSPPVLLGASNFNNAASTVTWTAPANNGGSPVTSYVVRYSTDGGSSWATASTTTMTSEAVTGLTNGDTYIFDVLAVNAKGQSAPSGMSSPITPAVLPGAPTGVSATNNENAQSEVTWLAPASNGGASITDYVVQYSSNGGTTWTQATSSATTTSYLVTGLTNTTAYVFQVAAVTGAGQGPFSASSPSATPASTLVAAIPTVSSDQSGLISWSWSGASGGVAPYSYQWTLSPPTTQCSSGTTTSLTLSCSDLIPGDFYTFEVITADSAGSAIGAWVSAYQQPYTAPAAPQSVVATSGDSSATVAWNPPSTDGGSPITLYTVTDSTNTFSCTTTNYSCVVTGLTNGTSYTFTVEATNALGTGSASAPSNPVVPAPLIATTIAATVTNTAGGSSATATITTANGATSETGTVTIYDNTTSATLCVSYVVAGQISCTYTKPTSTGTWTATYSGDSTFASSSTTGSY